MAYIWILLTIIILLLGLLIYLNIKDYSQSSDSKVSLRDIDKAVERQETKLSDLSIEIQSFQDPHDDIGKSEFPDFCKSCIIFPIRSHKIF